MCSTRCLVVVGAALTLGETGAHAETDPADPVTAEDIAQAPRPEHAARYERPPRPPRRRPAPEEAVLEVPRVIVKGALAPVRLALWAEDRYHLSARARELLWNDEGTRGVLPVASWQGGRSLSAGAALVDRDLGGADAELRGTIGTSERYAVAATLGTGRLLGAWRIEGGGGYRDIADASFFGYGDADGLDGEPAMQLDPTAGVHAIESRFGERETTLRAAVLRRIDGLVLSAGGSMRWLEFGAPRILFGDEPLAVTEAYDTSALPGWDRGVAAARAELGLLFDRRRTRHRLQSKAAPSAGFASQLYAGWEEGVGGDPTRFGYGGVDAIQYIDLYRGDRVLSLRVTLDAAVGALDRIPFVELPTLGGGYLLRGYETGRFRDRWAATASVEYTWPVTEGVASFVFVDAGRVARVADELVDRAPRTSAGIGLQLHSKSSLLARMWVAGNADGGVMTSLKLDGFFGRRPREKVVE